MSLCLLVLLYIFLGPYDVLLPGMSSVINWFYISHSPQERGHPKRLLYDLIEDTELPEQESTLWVRRSHVLAYHLK